MSDTEPLLPDGVDDELLENVAALYEVTVDELQAMMTLGDDDDDE